MGAGLTEHRSFSDEKHLAGQWRSRPLRQSNRSLRTLLGFFSYKRSGVDHLARSMAPLATVIDLGAGQGAYTHWFLDAARNATVIALDWSAAALARIPPPRHGKIYRICADAQMLPLKEEIADALFSVDTLGHLPDIGGALDEALRVTKGNAGLFIHSECGNYRRRWPDAMLMRRLGHDYLAGFDGHLSVLPAEELRSLVSRRFQLVKAWSPAGLTGWLTGYPEKYRLAFEKAGCKGLALVTAVFALIKRLPVLGLLLRLANSCVNHMELALGLDGGGSFFAVARKPARAAVAPHHGGTP